jgi:xylulokinase
MDQAGRILATATGPHDVLTPHPGWSQQEPQQWWQATRQAVRKALSRARGGAGVAGIGLSGQMHGLVMLNGAGRPIRPAIIWNDQRTACEARDIEQQAGGKGRLIQLVGNVAMTSFTLTKLLWVRRHEPRHYRAMRHLLLPKDYVRLRLTGQYAGDVSDMSGTLMLDQRRRDWSQPILRLFDIDSAVLPKVYESHQVVGQLTRGAAAELGLRPGVPVVAGAGDQPAGAVGNGVVAPGLTSATLGTSGVVYVHSKDYVVDPRGRVQTFCSAVDGEYCLFGCVLAAGGSFQWFRNTLGQLEQAQARRRKTDPYELLTAQAAAAPPGCRGVFWLPYLTGERTPHADPFARAGWIGIHAGTTRAELVRAVLEGATFAMNDALSILRGRGLRIRQVRLSGGGARSAFWRQLQADIYGATCATINAEEGPAYGAALLAAVGAGRWPSVVAACREAIRVTRTIKPQPVDKRLYRAYYGRYVALYPALRDQFAAIARLP